MKTALRTVAALLATGGLVALFVGGCGNHLTTQEATKTCEDLATKIPAISGPTFDACVSCYENCEDCEQLGTSPESFACPGDKDEETASASGSSGSAGGGS